VVGVWRGGTSDAAQPSNTACLSYLCRPPWPSPFWFFSPLLSHTSSLSMIYQYIYVFIYTCGLSYVCVRCCHTHTAECNLTCSLLVLPVHTDFLLYVTRCGFGAAEEKMGSGCRHSAGVYLAMSDAHGQRLGPHDCTALHICFHY